MIGDNGILQYLRFYLFEMYVSVVFVIRCLYSAVSLTLVREQRFIKITDFFTCIKAHKNVHTKPILLTASDTHSAYMQTLTS